MVPCASARRRRRGGGEGGDLTKGRRRFPSWIFPKGSGAAFPRDVGHGWVLLGPAPGPGRAEPGDFSKQNGNFEAGGFVYSLPRLFAFLLIICFAKVLNLRSLNKFERENFWKPVTSLRP